MRKCNFLRGVLAVFSLLPLAAQMPPAATPDASSYSALAADRLQRAQENQVRIQALVDNGTLPPSLLLQAKEQVADVQDQATLSATLYSETKLQDLTTEQATAMVEAAERRRDRQARRLAELQKLLEQGIIARAEMANVESELAMRHHVVDLARNRVTLLEELRQMATAEEQRLEHNAHSGTMETSLIRYDGKAPFSVNDLPAIEHAFELRFHRSLPVSALGQSLVHQNMGLDHRNRVDVALNPELPEGLWLRQYLEAHKMPYLAFRNAVEGAATGAHIHIGTGSSRLKVAVLPHPPVG